MRGFLSAAVASIVIAGGVFGAIYARRNERQFQTATQSARDALKVDQQDGVPPTSLQTLSETLTTLDTKRTAGFIPVSWLGALTTAPAQVQDIHHSVLTLLRKDTLTSRRQATLSLQNLERTMGRWARPDLKTWQHQLSLATTPKALNQLTGNWDSLRTNWQTTVSHLSRIGGGLNHGRPSDILHLQGVINHMLTLPGLPENDIHQGQAASQFITAYFSRSPGYELQHHGAVKTDATSVIKKLKAAELALTKILNEPPNRLFGSAFARYLATRQSIVSVTVYNARTGKTYTYNPTLEFDTASIVKVSIMGTLLYQAQQHHTALTVQEQNLMVPMIEQSSNSAATSLWNLAGGATGVGAFMRAAGMSATLPNTQGYWGLTQTTTEDQVTLLKRFALPNSFLDAQSRQYGLNLMDHVVSWEDWGVSAGTASDATVALKNGWLPIGSSGWEMNSIGSVNGDSRDYEIAVLTRNNPSEAYGIDTIQGISQLIWSEL